MTTEQGKFRGPSAPGRLALQTGSLDDHRCYLAPGDARWDAARQHFADRDRSPRLESDEDLRALCELWPKRESEAPRSEALAVTVALAAPCAGPDRILQALASDGPEADRLRHELGHAPKLAEPTVPRPRFPFVYDPDAEAPAPIVACIDGPPSALVAQFLTTIRERDQNLADAIVLGAELEMLEMLDRLGLTAKRAARQGLADHFAEDLRRWRQRAEEIRCRQRLEASHYDWKSDNLPPGCLDAAEANAPQDVQTLLQRISPPVA